MLARTTGRFAAMPSRPQVSIFTFGVLAQAKASDYHRWRLRGFGMLWLVVGRSRPGFDYIGKRGSTRH